MKNTKFDNLVNYQNESSSWSYKRFWESSADPESLADIMKNNTIVIKL